MTTSPTTSTPTRPSRALAWVVLVAAIVQVVTPAVQALGDLGAPPSSQGDDLLITPSGYTFSIWSLVYLLTIAYAIAVLVKRATGTVASGRLLGDLALLYLGASLWIVASAFEWSWITAVILLVMVVIAVDAAHVAAARTPDTEAPTWLTRLARATTGLYAGWVTAAGGLNVCTALVADGDFDGMETSWQVWALALVALVAVGFSALIGGSIAYAAALVWALVGVVVAVRDTSGALVATAVVAAIAIVAVNALLLLRRRSRT
ncbi:MFS transporter [Mumia sp. ZJ1417]|uniref:MFS transporter n=1 Tax=unclassified Mumia TaxID=2621872 RepID=UPI001421EE1A|nr:MULTISPECIES: MFS transporter [unclassified Mumia]QMW66376.1 MFS transporter [Mumia sp. ZJ1417]